MKKSLKSLSILGVILGFVIYTNDEKLYNNPLTDDYMEPQTIPYSINFQKVRYSPSFPFDVNQHTEVYPALI
ncbi:MAG: hypothetical protein C4293_04685 [Nitrospiraceae bacterium]